MASEGTAAPVRWGLLGTGDITNKVVRGARRSGRGLSCSYEDARGEGSGNRDRFGGVRYGHRAAGGDLRSLYEQTREAGFGAEVKRRIMLGTYALSSGD